MKFIVSRTSGDLLHPEIAPCERVFQEIVKGEPVWFVEISSLEELMGFAGKYMPIIIEKSYFAPHYWKIEIYDDWRE